MLTHNEIQGTPEWLALRRDYFTASEAPAMMGVSPYMTRSELLQQKATGITPEVDERTQARFDAGHAAEAAFRVIAEEIIGEELYPVTGSTEIDGLKLLASFDGLTMTEQNGFEHKLYNASLAEAIELDHEIPSTHYWQLEHQLLVSGADTILFATTDGTKNKCAMLTYSSHPDRRAALVAGWKQFAKDLAEYVPAEYVAPAPTGRAPESLPALRIELTGVVTASNLQVYKETALAVFAGINRELTTDQHFSDAEKTVKWCADIEERIKAAKQHALSQTESIDLLFRTMDEISNEARTVRLELDKLTKNRKEALRGEIVREGRDAYDLHVRALNERLGKPYMPAIAPDFAGAIKGKKNFDSMRDAVATALANAKIDANAKADAIDANMKSLRELAAEHAFLFADTPHLVTTKANDDLVLLINSRIADHKAKEAARLEAERERIRAEEQAKLEKAAADKAAADKAAADKAAEAARVATEEAARIAAAQAVAASQPKPEEAPQAAPVVSPIPPAPAPEASGTVLAFLASRNWSTPAAERTARSTLIEFERFRAHEQLKAA